MGYETYIDQRRPDADGADDEAGLSNCTTPFPAKSLSFPDPHKATSFWSMLLGRCPADLGSAHEHFKNCRHITRSNFDNIILHVTGIGFCI